LFSNADEFAGNESFLSVESESNELDLILIAIVTAEQSRSN
jgi:hypothetical protein